jgi:hypothetical protein
MGIALSCDALVQSARIIHVTNDEIYYRFQPITPEPAMNTLTADLIKQSGIVIPTLAEIEEMQRVGKISRESRKLTSTELAQARANRSARSARFDVGDESEARGSGFLGRLFHCEIKKNPLREIQNPMGRLWVSMEVDYTLNRPTYTEGAFRVTNVEVKGTRTKNFPLDRISDRERGFLDRSVRRGNDTWVLCLWWDEVEPDKFDCDLMHLVPWPEWKQIEADLLAKASGNYKGRSIRRKIDLKTSWEKYAIVKGDNGCWQLDPSHWLRAKTQPVHQLTQGDA